MQTAKLHISTIGLSDGDGFRVYGNVGTDGVVAASDSVLTGPSAIQLFPRGVTPSGRVAKWFTDWTWLVDWFRDIEVPERVWETPAMYHGRYEFDVRSEDSLGNETSGADAHWEMTIISGPELARGFHHSESVDGRPVFTFTPSAQM